MEATNRPVAIACPNGCFGMISAQLETKGDYDRYKYICHKCDKIWYGNWQRVYAFSTTAAAVLVTKDA